MWHSKERGMARRGIQEEIPHVRVDRCMCAEAMPSHETPTLMSSANISLSWRVDAFERSWSRPH